MKVILEKDYEYLGEENGWYKFISRPKENYDPEIIQVRRARVIRVSGESWFCDLKPTSTPIRA